MNQLEKIDVLMGISGHNFIVTEKEFEVNSTEAGYAHQMMSVVAGKAISDGYSLFRQVGGSYIKLEPETYYQPSHQKTITKKTVR